MDERKVEAVAVALSKLPCAWRSLEEFARAAIDAAEAWEREHGERGVTFVKDDALVEMTHRWLADLQRHVIDLQARLAKTNEELQALRDKDAS